MVSELALNELLGKKVFVKIREDSFIQVGILKKNLDDFYILHGDGHITLINIDAIDRISEGIENE